MEIIEKEEIKIINGGMYLVNLGLHKNPELSSPHYCVILKTHDSGLLLCLPTTSKPRENEKYKKTIPEDNSTCLFKQSKFISKKRVLKHLCYDNGSPIIISNENLTDLLKEYNIFLSNTFKNAIRGNADYLKNLETLKVSV